MRISFLGGMILCLSFSSTSAEHDWQFNGYLNQGLIVVEDSPFIVNDDNYTLDITEAMATASWRLNPAIRFAGGLTFRQWGTLAEPRLDLDYLFGEYRWQLHSGHLGIRAGRMKNEVGFYSSSRDMSFTRPGIMLPQSIYADYFRDAQLRIDGVDLFGAVELGAGLLNWHLMAGKNAGTESLTENTFGTQDVGQFDGRNFHSFDLEYQVDNLRLGATYYHADLGFDAISIYSDGKIEIDTWVFSANYMWRYLELTGEYLFGRRSTQGIYVSPQQESRLQHRGFYLETALLLPHDTEVFLRYDDYIDDTSDPNGTEYAASSGNPDYFTYSKDWTLGGRWLINKNWLIAAEYHWIEGAFWVSPILNRDPKLQGKNWSMFALQLSYRVQW